MTQSRRPYLSPHIQPLEARRLLASFATLNEGTLTLTGTKRAEAFVLLERSGKLRVLRDGVEVRFNVSSVTKVIASLNAGNDSFVMNSALSIPATVFGGSGNDTITTGRGSDRIEGGDGNDVVDCGYGDDRMYGGDGIDILTYRSSLQKIRGVLHATETDYLSPYELKSDGKIWCGSELDRHVDFEKLIGTRFGDDLEFSREMGTSMAFEIAGGDGNDVLRATRSGNPFDGSLRFSGKLLGGDGNDFLSYDTAFGSSLLISGDRGNDVLENLFEAVLDKPTTTTVSGGDGIDLQILRGATVWASEGITSAAFSLAEDVENLLVNSAMIEGLTFRGNDSDNQITLTTLKAVIYGGSGNDTIIGGNNDDTIYGDAGDDIINGGDGADWLYGGAGTDRGKKQSTDRAFDSIETLL